MLALAFLQAKEIFRGLLLVCPQSGKPYKEVAMTEPRSPMSGGGGSGGG
jgi:hypothetical protein